MKIILLPAILIMAFGMLSMGQSQSPTTPTSHSPYPSPSSSPSISQSQSQSQSQSPDPDTDIKEIVALQEEQAAAWNRRDTAGYAVAHVLWTMDGAKSPPGSPAPPREGIQLQILQKTVEGWRIVSFQNTNSIAEVPFPTSPPGITPSRN